MGDAEKIRVYIKIARPSHAIRAVRMPIAAGLRDL
jgi:hypothetical protein